MPKPWEKYKTPEKIGKPWEKYSPQEPLPPQEESLFGRMGNAISGAYDSVAGGVKALATEPGGQNTVVDSAGMGWGNEIIEGVKALGKSATDGQGPEKTFFDYYNPGMVEVNASKKTFEEDHPGASLAGSILPSVVTGGVGMKILNPKTWGSALKYAVGEGAVIGSGEADQGAGNRAYGGVVGAVTGAVGGAGGTLLEKTLGTVIPGAWKAGAKLFTGAEKELGPGATREQALKYVANYLKQTGDTPEVIASKLRSLTPGENTTLADVMENGAPLVKRVAANSDEASDVTRKSLLNRDNEALNTQLKTNLGAGTPDIKSNIKFEQGLTDTKRAIGDEMRVYGETVHGTPLGNQDAINDWLEKAINKPDVKSIDNALDLRGLKRLSGDQVPGWTGDPNALVNDEVFMQKYLSELKRKKREIKSKTTTGSEADLNERISQGEKLLSKGRTDDTMKEIQNRYRGAASDERAYKSAADFSSLKESGVLKLVDGMTPSELEAYRKGVITHLADKETGLLEFLTPGVMNKMYPVFKATKTGGIEDILSQSKAKKKVSEAATLGIDSMVEGVVGRTIRGMLLSSKDILGRLKNQRAYSAKGGVFLVGNEVVDVMLHSDLPKGTITEIMRVLSTSGDEVPKLLKSLATVEMPKLVKQEMLDKASSAVAKARMGAYASGSATLGESILGDN